MDDEPTKESIFRIFVSTLGVGSNTRRDGDWLRETGSEAAEATFCSGAFHARGPAIGNARSPWYPCFRWP